MKKKFTVFMYTLILLGVLMAGFFLLQTEAATCTSGRGDVCEGDCCISNFYTCKAGPCDRIFPF